VADGRIVPLHEVTLNSPQTGTVAQVLVAEGDMVTAGQALVRLDTRALQLRLDQANVGLARAQTKYDQLMAGATPANVAVAKAGVHKAEAVAAQITANVSNADVDAAKSQLADANATLKNLTNPTANDRALADAAVDQATANLTQQRSALSAAKTAANLAMQQAVQTLSQAQISYASAKDNWQYVQDNSRDPFYTSMRLSDAQKQNYYDAMVRAESAMHVAELQLQNAQVAYANAQQAETSGVMTAEARLTDAQVRRDNLLNPDAGQVAAAQARVSAAQANVARLQGSARNAQLDTAAADVAQAQAQYEQVVATPRAVDVSAADVEIAAAKVAVAQAQYELDQATLTAPFAGVVADMDLTVGMLLTPAIPALVLADTQTWHVETVDLTELDVVGVAVGDVASVHVDALPDVTIPATVRHIQALGQNRQGDIVYTVVLDLQEHNADLRWNMTVAVHFAQP
jgi:HlyD family secretion protein